MEPALAVLIISGFVGLILWGRTTAGQATLTRIYGAPSVRSGKNARTPRRTSRATPPAASRTKQAQPGGRKAADATGARTPRRSTTGAAKRPAAKRGGTE